MKRMFVARASVAAMFCFGLLCASLRIAEAETVPLQLTVRDEKGDLLPSLAIVRPVIDGTLRDAVAPVDGLHWQGYVQHPGRVQYNLEPGEYQYVLDRSSEYATQAGHLVVTSGQPVRLQASLTRLTNFRQRGWFSSDLHIHRAFQDGLALAQAADLDLAPTITWWNKVNRFPTNWRNSPPISAWKRTDDDRWLSPTAGEDERQGGALLYFQMTSPIDITRATREFPSPLHFVELAKRREPDVWVDIEKPFWWDMPTWIAHGVGDSIGICNNHLQRDGMLANEAWGKSRDELRFPNPAGNGMWTQEIYYRLLNCGIRIPPSAGSASGVLRNPVGYNRVYVYLSERLSPDAWWQSLAAGHCFVTNGPLIDCRINGRLPGDVLTTNDDQITLDVNLELVSRDPIRELQLIVNGAVAKRVPLEASTTHHQVRFQQVSSAPGWCLLRAVADHHQTYRFVSTGPFYLESRLSARYVDAKSVDFFHTWVRERMAQIEAADLQDQELTEVLQYHKRALQFWSLDARTQPLVPERNTQ